MSKLNKQTAKKKFANSVCEFLRAKVTESSHGRYPNMFRLSEDGNSIMCDLPADFFFTNEIDPMTVEMKFTVKK